MFCLDENVFFNYISNTSEPIHLTVRDLASGNSDIDSRSYMKKFNDAFNKNKNSSEFVLNFSVQDEFNATVLFNRLTIPTTIKTLGVSHIILEYPTKFILPCSITKLKLSSVFDIFKIDFSKNVDLQVIEIKVCHMVNLDSDYSDDVINLSHIYGLQKIYLIDNGLCEKDRNKNQRNYK